MWFLWNLNPAGAEYNLPMAWTIRSRLDAAALAASLHELVLRHPVLRTTYAAPHGELKQLIHPAGQAGFHQIDTKEWSAQQLHTALSEAAHLPFDLKEGPVFRCHLFARGDSEHVLLLNSHHIATDTWSLIVMMEELGELYRARLAHQTPQLPPASLQYTDYVGWQHDLLASTRGEEHAAYWQKQLAAPPTLDLPTDRARPPVQGHAGAGQAFQLDEALTAQVRALARQEGVTLYTVLLAAFYALLYRYTGQDDLAVGSPRFGRPPRGYERTVGYFASPCALRVQLDGATTFSQFLHQVREVLVGAKEHQDFPFPLVVERLGLPRDLSRSPVFQVAFTYQKSHLPHMQGVAAARMGLSGASLDLAGLRLDSYPLELRSVKFDLDFVVEEVDGALQGVCWYNTDLWDQGSVASLVEHYQTLLLGATQAPGLALDRLPLLTPRDRRHNAERNETAAPFPHACAHRLFEQRAVQTPSAPALRFGEDTLSYEELDRCANRLAHHLCELGLQPGQLVGLSMERGQPGLVIGLLAILKAGGAYLPLDPEYPSDRLAYMLEDAGAGLLLTQASVRERLPAGSARLVCLDTDCDAIARMPHTAPKRFAAPTDLAYVIYTSGSTGRPKGVMLEHQGLSNMVHAMIAGFEVAPDSRMLQFASSSFDASVSEIFTTLCAGACLCLAPKIELIPGPALVRTIARHAVTVVTLPPSVLALLQPAELPTLKTLITAGEACSLELARRWSAACRFINAYGPTEATVCASMAVLHPHSESVSIGKPLANTQLYVLDRLLQPVPRGVAGELYIAGIGLARGYLGRPDLTGERFVANPFGAPGERMYKTGDLTRYLPDGGLEFLGRLDHQVKLRGFRIELGELEAVIAEHPGIREALVLSREQRLVAYAVTHAGAAVTGAALRTHVQAKLPDFMVPAAFVLLDAWPMTPNGKIDRRALPAPPERRADAAIAPPRDQLEQQIAAIWKTVLNLSVVGIDDSFFDVGGHSMLVVEVEVLIEEKLGLTVSTMDLFRFPTIRALAAHLRGTRTDEQASAPVAPSVAPAGTAIAIVGMAGRFPGAASVEAFWRNLRAGTESITDLTDEQLEEAGVDAQLLREPRYVKRKGILDDVACFDAPFFGYPPREAQLMDPQQRLFLELGWQALEHAGYSSETCAGRIGVVGGTGRAGYLQHFLDTRPESAAELFQTTILNEKDFLATRLAHKLNLRGPALTVQTACSTSLVAVHLACQQLLQGDSDMVLAGGISLEVPHATGYMYQEGHILSPDGRCRPFDAAAGGTVRGSGGALVVLKRLADAQRDGDTIWAVIKGSAINNDGSGKVGFTAPSVDGQAEVIEQALRRAGVDPRSIGLVEAHGTATPLGDPIEVAALTQAYRRHTPDRAYCLLGSVKANVGHLDTAAGVTGLIKAVLALHHGEVPGTPHFQSPNPKLDLERSPFRVNAALAPWPASATPRRAAVSSFGIGGTNAHVILEQAPAAVPTADGPRHHLLTLSAKSPTALEAMQRNLADYLRDHPEVNLADLAFTLQTGRAHLPYRSAAVGTASSAPAVAALPAGAARVTFLFPGQGLQQVNMGRELYDSLPEFRADVDACAELLQPVLGLDLRTVLYPAPEAQEAAALQLAQTAITQPAMFVVEYALARQLMHWGVQPHAMMGHSLGEYVAACLAGVMNLSDALMLVAARGQLVQQLPGGAMLAVEASAAALQPFLGAGVDLAVVNGPNACVLAGPTDAIAALAAPLEQAGLRNKRVPTSHAFHSAMLDSILERFRARLDQVALHAPRIPYITNVTGSWVTAEQATDPAHWVRHMRQTVRFAEGLALLLETPDGLFLEAGPGQTFSGILRRHPARGNLRFAGPTLAGASGSDCGALLTSVGRLWSEGVALDWQTMQGDVARRRIALPLYPFDRHRYWPDARPATAVAAPVQHSAPRDAVELEVAKVFEEILGMERVALDDSFFDLGGSSLSSLNVILRLEQLFDCSLSSAILLEHPTVETLARALRSGSASSRLVGLRTTGSQPPLFCIHPYGGHTMGYVELTRCLGADQPVYGVQARGLQGEAEPVCRIEDMAADYIALIKTRQPNGPYRLVGHSMGGCIAYEMATQLRRAGEDVALLALIDSRAHNASAQPLYRNGAYGPLAGKDWLDDDAVLLGILLPRLAMDWDSLRGVAADRQWLHVLDTATQQGLLAPEGGREQMRQMLAVTRANDTALRAYQPPSGDLPVMLFCGSEGFAQQFGEPDLGWRELATLERVELPGNHHTVMAGAGVAAIARRLQS